MLKIFLEILKMLSSKTSSKAPNIATEAPNIATEALNIATEAPNIATEAPNIATEAPNIKSEKMSKQPKTYITTQDVITSSGRYPDRAKSPELTQEVLANIAKTVELVNALLNELDWQEKVSISSGFRTSASNSATKGAAKKSAHMLGMAVDIQDPKQILGKKIIENHEKLKTFNLWLEDIEFTKTWCHLDTRPRSKREKNVFKP